MRDAGERAAAIPLLDLRAQYDSLRSEVGPVIERVIESQRFILGPEVVALEEEVAAYCHVPHAVGVSSGTDALLLALMSLDIAPGDEIITTPYSFFATAGVIHRLGARIVFVDIDPVSFNLDPNQLEAAVSSRTRAVIPIHLYGRCADMQPIVEVARRHDLRVVEDAAQAIGAEYGGQRACTFGDAGCLSFFPSKNLGAYGDGGMITVRDAALFEKMRVLRVHGGQPKYYHKLVGGNFRLDALQAAVLRVKLRHLDNWSAARRSNAEDYNQRFATAGIAAEEITVPEIPSERHIFNQYVIRARDRDGLVQHLRENQIGCEIYYPVPLHLQECFAYLDHKRGEFPESERAAAETLALPIYPELTGTQRQRVVDCVTGFYR